MGRRVTIRAGLSNIQLPDGGNYKGGDSVVLTDQQFQQIAPTALGDEVIDAGYSADPGDAVVAQAPSVNLTSTVAAGANPTKAEFDALRADVSAILSALKGAGRPMTP